MKNRIFLNSIDRVIAHKVHAKTNTDPSFAVTSSSLLIFNDDEMTILKNRISDALKNSKKTFELEYEDQSPESLYQALKTIKHISDSEFIDLSAQLADKLAEAHYRTSIPGGFCLIGNGYTLDNKYFFFVIKAELQEAFSINSNNELKVIKEMFLSPAKDFYKIGFFVESKGGFTPIMYDDQFSLQKKDLTEYFYSQFLGLTTHRNDKLLTKNFYDSTKTFIENNVDNIQDRNGLIKALNVLYREETSGIISPQEFSENYLEGKLQEKYTRSVLSQFSEAFTKDTILLDRKLQLQRITIPLTYYLSLVGNSNDLYNNGIDISIMDNLNQETLNELIPKIETGQVNKMILLLNRQDQSQKKY